MSSNDHDYLELVKAIAANTEETKTLNRRTTKLEGEVARVVKEFSVMKTVVQTVRVVWYAVIAAAVFKFGDLKELFLALKN